MRCALDKSSRENQNTYFIQQFLAKVVPFMRQCANHKTCCCISTVTIVARTRHNVTLYYSTCIVGIMFQNLALKKGSDLRKLWSKIPDGIDFKIYMFNITNPMDVQVGKKPIVTEIGPYFYE